MSRTLHRNVTASRPSTSRWSNKICETPVKILQSAAHLDPGQSEEWFRIIVDGDHFGSTKVPVQPGLNDLVLATGLPNAPHTVELVKETYRGTNATFHGFTVHTPDIGLLANAPEPAMRIVFYGDSNLAGDSVEHEQNNASWEYRGSHFTLAYMIEGEKVPFASVFFEKPFHSDS